MASKPIHPAEAALAEADASFTATGNGLEALDWVRLAAKAGLPVPPAIGAWLAAGIDQFRAGEVSLDEALNLRGTGKADPRRARRESAALQVCLSRMFVLHMLGATIEQAALMVARLGPDYKPATLEDRYTRSRPSLGKRAKAQRIDIQSIFDASSLQALLSEYPDKPEEIRRAKVAILEVHAKALASRALPKDDPISIVGAHERASHDERTNDD